MVCPKCGTPLLEWNDGDIIQALFQYEDLEYDIRATRYVAHCARCHRHFYKLEKRFVVNENRFKMVMCRDCFEWVMYAYLGIDG